MEKKSKSKKQNSVLGNYKKRVEKNFGPATKPTRKQQLVITTNIKNNWPTLADILNL